jgi:hypothetical protein
MQVTPNHNLLHRINHSSVNSGTVQINNHRSTIFNKKFMDLIRDSRRTWPAVAHLRRSSYGVGEREEAAGVGQISGQRSLRREDDRQRRTRMVEKERFLEGRIAERSLGAERMMGTGGCVVRDLGLPISIILTRCRVRLGTRSRGFLPNGRFM